MNRIKSYLASEFYKRDVTVQPIDEPVVDFSLQNRKLTAYGFSIPLVKGMLSGLKASRTTT